MGHAVSWVVVRLTIFTGVVGVVGLNDTVEPCMPERI